MRCVFRSDMQTKRSSSHASSTYVARSKQGSLTLHPRQRPSQSSPSPLTRHSGRPSGGAFGVWASGRVRRIGPIRIPPSSFARPRCHSRLAVVAMNIVVRPGVVALLLSPGAGGLPIRSSTKNPLSSQRTKRKSTGVRREA